MDVLIVILFSYLSGSIPFGLILTKIFGDQDVRNIGSGNIGATNVLRTGNKFLAALTLLLDILKGYIPVIIAQQYFPGLIQLSCLLAFLGHVFPVWLKFKGGKGVATMLGVILFISMSCVDGSRHCWRFNFLELESNIFFISVFSWLMIIFITRYVALGSVISLTVATVYSFFYIPDLFLFFVLMTLLITYKHKDNFERIRNKTEHKISF